VVSLGAVGALSRVTLDVEPSYEVAQRVFVHLAWDALFDHFDEVTSSGYSVTLFTDWGESIDQVWIKTRTTDSPAFTDVELFGAKAAQTDRHPIPGMDRSTARPSWASLGPGGNVSHISGSGSRRATTRRTSGPSCAMI
jgi:alditol oxidase